MNAVTRPNGKFQLAVLPVSNLEACDRVRVRKIKPKDGTDLVLEYAEAYQCGLITEPLEVFKENGTERYIVADGENRLLALARAKIKTVECRLHEGDEIDALRFAIGCNQAHGQRRTKADIYHAFCRVMETSLRDEFRTDSQLAELLGVSIRTIHTYKADWRESEGGGKRTQEKKEKARESATKNTKKSTRQSGGTMQVASSKETVKQDVISNRPTFAQANNTSLKAPENAAPTSKTTPRKTVTDGAPPISRVLLASFRRGISLLAEVPPMINFADELTATDWKLIEDVRQLLVNLLESR